MSIINKGDKVKRYVKRDKAERGVVLECLPYNTIIVQTESGEKAEWDCTVTYHDFH